MAEALWAAMRTLEKKISLLRRTGARSGDERAAECQQEAGQFDRQVETIRQILIARHAALEKKSRSQMA